MQNQPPVLITQDQLLDTYREITRDKIALLTQALAARGRIRKHRVFTKGFTYDPLVDALARLTSIMRRITPDDFNPTQWREAITFANDMWWDWYDFHPLPTPQSHVNTAPHHSERAALREQLRQKYTPVGEVISP